MTQEKGKKVEQTGSFRDKFPIIAEQIDKFNKDCLFAKDEIIDICAKHEFSQMVLMNVCLSLLAKDVASTCKTEKDFDWELEVITMAIKIKWKEEIKAEGNKEELKE